MGASVSTLADPAPVEVPLGFSDTITATVSPATSAISPQDHIEPVLLEHYRSLGLGEIRFSTELVAFDTSPFPWDGTAPGQDKPFYDVEQDGRRGHTSPRGGIYWEDTTYSDRRVLLHIPRGFNPALPGVMIVYFHGNMANLERVVQRQQQVPRQVAQSGLNAVLVAPQFALDALDSSAGRFYDRGAFRRFLEEAGRRLAHLHGDAKSRVAIEWLPAIIVAYSGGYAPAAYAAHNGGAGDRLRGIVLLDALYAEMDKFAGWYRNPAFNVAVTYLEPLPVALIMSLVSAGVLSRRRKDGVSPELTSRARAST